jgi:hypothetical protein
MKCQSCNHPVLDMEEIHPGVFECSLCGLIFDLGHAEKAEKELIANGYISLSNDELADQWVEYFKLKFPEIKYSKMV